MSDNTIVYVEAYACSDFGDGPEFATFALTDAFLPRLRGVRTVVKEHALSEARIYAGPDEWGPGNLADDLRLNCAELVVTGDSFWFVDQPKHADYHIETRIIPFDALDEALASGESIVIFGDDPEALEQRISETVSAD
jgi:hypothetical protein